MKIVSYQVKGRHVLGLWERDEVVNLTELDPEVFSSFTELTIHAHRKKKTIEQTIAETMKNSVKEPNRDILNVDDERLLIPLNPAEVWACGVTYRRSQKAREYETGVKGIYDLVYDAVRPEIFFKTSIVQDSQYPFRDGGKVKVFVEPDPGAMIVFREGVRLEHTPFGVLLVKSGFRDLPAGFEVRHPSKKKPER